MLEDVSVISQRLQKAFERNFNEGLELGAAYSFWKDGREVASGYGGYVDTERSVLWDEETLVLVWSATKGVTSATLLHALDKNGVSTEARVGDIWPEFAANGKEAIRISEVMSHRAGLSALSAPGLRMLEAEVVVNAIERQAPQFEVGFPHAYSPRVYGFIVDEILRRITGERLGDYWRKYLADPAEIDFWIGLPEGEHSRVAQMVAPRAQAAENKISDDPFLEAISDSKSLAYASFISPGGLPGASSMNTPRARAASLPSLGGIGSASALAKFYSLLAMGESEYFSHDVLKKMWTPLSSGPDGTLRHPTAFSCGFMLDPVDEGGQKVRKIFGSGLRAFGHPGAGGSLAFADPESGIAFAYVMNQMSVGALPRIRATRLVDAIFQD